LTITASMRNALLAPSAPQWPVMLRQKNAVDRQIERKLKLLLTLQEARKRREPVVGVRSEVRNLA